MIFELKWFRMDRRRRRPRVTRSSVSLDSGDYAKVCAIAAQSRPPLPVRYVIELAVVRFLDRHKTGSKVDVTAELGAWRSTRAGKR